MKRQGRLSCCALRCLLLLSTGLSGCGEVGDAFTEHVLARQADPGPVEPRALLASAHQGKVSDPKVLQRLTDAVQRKLDTF
jgi:hypothetical protein